MEIKIYVKDLIRGKKKFKNVPDRFKEEVIKSLLERGYIVDGDEIIENKINEGDEDVG